MDLFVLPPWRGPVLARAGAHPRSTLRYGHAALIVAAVHAAALTALWHGAAPVIQPPQVMDVLMLPPPVAVATPAPPAPVPKPQPRPENKPAVTPLPKPAELPRPEPPPVTTELPAPAIEAPPAVAPVAPAEAPPVAAPAPEPVIVPPRLEASYKGNPAPPYPDTSRRLGEEGVVLLRIFVKVDGSVGGVKLARSSGFPRLDRVAAETVRRWRLIPARRGDEPFATWYTLPIEFNLEK